MQVSNHKFKWQKYLQAWFDVMSTGPVLVPGWTGMGLIHVHAGVLTDDTPACAMKLFLRGDYAVLGGT